MIKKIVCLGCFVLTDVLAYAASFYLARHLDALLRGRAAAGPFLEDLRLSGAAGLIVLLVLFAFDKHYVRRFSFWEEYYRVLKDLATAFVVTLALTEAFPGRLGVSRRVLILTFLLGAALLPLSRRVVKTVLFELGLWRKRVVVIGTRAMAEAIRDGMRHNRILGYELVGLVSDEPEGPSALPILGRLEEADRVCRESGAQDAVIALPGIGAEALSALFWRCENFLETVRVIIDAGDLFTFGVEIEPLGPALSISVARNLSKPWNTFLKRATDLILAALLLVPALPLLAVLAAAVRLDSRGPIFFRQERIGKGGRPVRIFKLRTMRLDGDEVLRRALQGDERLRREWQEFRKIKSGDPRVTRVGRFLRRTSLDELPQLFNILRGEMSIVGPRPYLAGELEEMGQSRHFITQVRPGLTGLWQSSGRNELTFRERVRLDEHYIRNWSFWFDLVIFFKTFRILSGKKGAY